MDKPKRWIKKMQSRSLGLSIFDPNVFFKCTQFWIQLWPFCDLIMIIYHNILSLLLVQYTHTHTHLSTLHYKGVEEVNSWCRLKLGPFSLSLSLSLSVCVCVCV